MGYTVLNQGELRLSANAYEFEGYLFADNTGPSNTSFIWLDLPPGHGPRLHKHTYGEIFIIQEGRATYIVGLATIEAEAGQIVLAPPDVPHKFVNSGEGPLRQIDVHLNNRIVTEWLEAERGE